MNLNDLAVLITTLEGKKVELTIAQIKEVIKCVGRVLHELDSADSSALVAKIIAKGAC